MMLAEVVQTAELGQGTIAVLATVFIIPALGALVKWWMSGTEKSIAAIAHDVRELTGSVNVQSQAIAVLQARLEQHEKELEQLRRHHHELGNTVQRMALAKIQAPG